jgi:uncharacterized membrane protein YedE/YeeE
MRVGAAAALLGVAFGFVLSWSQITDPDVVRRMLLLEDEYLFLLMGSATAVAFIGVRLLRRLHMHALVTHEPVGWTTTRPARHHLIGSILFGVGWGLSNSCPGPIAAQLGLGMFWSLFTIGGIVIGVRLHARRQADKRVRSIAAASSARA